MKLGVTILIYCFFQRVRPRKWGDCWFCEKFLKIITAHKRGFLLGSRRSWFETRKSRILQSMWVASGESHQAVSGSRGKALERVSKALLESQVWLLRETQAILPPYFTDEEGRSLGKAPGWAQEAQACHFTLGPLHYVRLPLCWWYLQIPFPLSFCFRVVNEVVYAAFATSFTVLLFNMMFPLGVLFVAAK